jgi:hypothetical protein
MPGSVTIGISGLNVSGFHGTASEVVGVSFAGAHAVGFIGSVQNNFPVQGHLGYFQAGDFVRISLATQVSGVPVAPDAAPVMVITNPSSVALPVQTMAMNGEDTSWLVNFFLGNSSIVGIYRIVFTFFVSGVEYTDQGSFSVVPGGDIGGDVISVYSFARPDATYVLAQLTSGVIVCGKNPTI